jgi:hypothetical protein
LKLQSQPLALQNMKDKAATQEYLEEGQILQQQMTSAQADFQFPRF